MPEPTRSESTLAQPTLHEPFLARAAEIDVRDQGSNGLGAFLTLRLVDQFAGGGGEINPAALDYQISATREFLRDLHPVTPEVTSLREIVRVAETAHATGEARMLIPPLLAFAFWLEEELRLEESLDVLETSLRLSDGRDAAEEVAARLQTARVLRLIGRLEQARAEYVEAENIAVRLHDTHSQLLARIGQGIVLNRLGNLPESERALRKVVADARMAEDRDAEARALHDLSATLYASGRIAEAIPIVFGAYQLYERPLHRARALSDTGLLLKELGLHDAAKQALTAVLSHDLSKEVRARTVLELLELSAAQRDRVSFERWRRELSGVYGALPLDERVDYEMKVGAGLVQFGQYARGEQHLQRAVSLAEHNRFGERLFKAEALLAASRERHTEASVLSAARAESETGIGPQLQDTLDRLAALEVPGGSQV